MAQNRPLTPKVTVVPGMRTSETWSAMPRSKTCGSLKRLATSTEKLSDGRDWYPKLVFAVEVGGDDLVRGGGRENFRVYKPVLFPKFAPHFRKCALVRGGGGCSTDGFLSYQPP